jgi:general secretion pathway protein D
MNTVLCAKRYALWLLALFLLCGCGAEMHRRDGISLIQEGRPEEGLAELSKAMEASPDSADYRQEYFRQREKAIAPMLRAAERARQNGDLESAATGFQRVLDIDSTDSRAQLGMEKVGNDKRHASDLKEAESAFQGGDAQRASEIVRTILAEDPDHRGALKLKQDISDAKGNGGLLSPSLQSTYSRPINLEFRDANVKMVFESLSRTTGINFIFDKDVRPDLRTTVYLHNASIDDALDLIAQTSQLQRKILSGNTVLMYPNTPEKLKDYQDLVIRGFYLKNTDAKTMQANLKQLFKGRDMIIDEKLNLIVMRDTPEAIRLAERVIAMYDIPEPEVMLELEVLEVQRSKLDNLGIQWPAQIGLTPLASGSSLTLADLKGIDSGRIGVTVGATQLNLNRQLTDVNILANPRIRVRNKDKAKIMIGDKLPVVTTTTTATGLVSDNVQYLDVGLKVDVQPEVRTTNDVMITLGLEVSSVTNQVTTPSGSIVYQVGTRNANTSLLLRDGETQILAGLINAQEHGSANRIPGIGDIPILGRLFGSKQDQNDKTEIVLSITPHILRGLKRPDISQSEFWSGTETNLRSKPMSFQSREPNKPSSPSAPTDNTDPTAADGQTSSALTNAAQAEVPARNVQLSWQGPATVKAGDTFKVALMAKADGTIRSLPLQLGYDPKVMQITDIVEGPFFAQNNGKTSFSKNIDTANGKAFVSVARSDVSGANGEGAVIYVNARALTDVGPSAIKVLQASAIAQSDVQPALAIPPAWGIATPQ